MESTQTLTERGRVGCEVVQLSEVFVGGGNWNCWKDGCKQGCSEGV